MRRRRGDGHERRRAIREARRKNEGCGRADGLTWRRATRSQASTRHRGEEKEKRNASTTSSRRACRKKTPKGRAKDAAFVQLSRRPSHNTSSTLPPSPPQALSLARLVGERESTARRPRAQRGVARPSRAGRASGLACDWPPLVFRRGRSQSEGEADERGPSSERVISSHSMVLRLVEVVGSFREPLRVRRLGTNRGTRTHAQTTARKWTLVSVL